MLASARGMEEGVIRCGGSGAGWGSRDDLLIISFNGCMLEIGGSDCRSGYMLQITYSSADACWRCGGGPVYKLQIQLFFSGCMLEIGVCL